MAQRGISDKIADDRADRSIFRTHDGGKFYLLATDLVIVKLASYEGTACFPLKPSAQKRLRQSPEKVRSTDRIKSLGR